MIEHIPRIKNVFVKLLTKWSQGHSVRQAVRGPIATLLYQSTILESTETNVISISEIENSQKKQDRPKKA